MRRFIVLAALSVLAHLPAMALADANTRGPSAVERVLFVGNSFSFYNNGLHNHVGNLLRAAGRWRPRETRLRLLSLSGAALPEHRGGLQALVGPGDWDVVVMHGHSVEPLDPERAPGFRLAVAEYSAFIRAQGAEPVLLMTWAYQGRPEMTRALHDAYADVAREHDLRLIPVGLAFDRATRELDVDLYLRDVLAFEEADGMTGIRYKRDVKHPSVAGTYLAACVVYAALFGESPEGLVYDAGLGADTARALQRVAAATVRESLVRP